MHETYCEYRNARTVNYNRWSDHTQVNKLVLELVASIKSKKIKGYIFNMKVLLLDLYHSYLSDPTQYISYYRDINHYDFKKRFKAGDRYVDNPHISYDYFVGSVDALIPEYITNKPGQNFYNEQEGVYGFLSKMRATTKLIELWHQYGWTPDMIGQWRPDDEVEVIILKGKTVEKKIPCTRYKKVNGVFVKRVGTKTIKTRKPAMYRDTPKTKQMRAIVHAYNRLLDRTHIDCDAACISDKDRADLIKKLKGYGKKKEPVIRLQLASKHVYRVFNDGDKTFILGGRFYSAWWIGCPGALRKYITLNGNPTIELDYSGIHIHLLYALEGINYASKYEDAYNLVCKLPHKDPDRDLNKLILLTALNAETETKARDSVYDQIQDDDELKAKYNMPNKQPIALKLKQLKEKHARIANYIAEGKGLMLQYYDSCIIEKLIGYAIKQNIPILTVHDSVICEAKNADLIKDKMHLYFTELLREKLKLTIKYTSVDPSAKQMFRKLIAEQNGYRMPPGLKLSMLPSVAKISGATADAWLRANALIEIKRDARDNTCSKTCNHARRIGALGSKRSTFLGTQVIRLVRDRVVSKLEVKD